MERVLIRHRTVEVNDISMHVAETDPEGNSKGTVLFMHGFPKLWYSWRHQMEHLSARGYHCVATDLRGYGGTTAPSDVESYSAFHIVGDIIALLDTLELAKVPAKYVVGDGDITYQLEGIQEYIYGGGFKKDVPLLEGVVVILGAGHFIQQEKAQKVCNRIYDFITKF